LHYNVEGLMRWNSFIPVLLAGASLAAASAVERWTTSTADTTTHHVNTQYGKVAVGVEATGNNGVALGASAPGSNAFAVKAAASGSGGIAVQADATGTGGKGVSGNGNQVGVYGTSPAGYGVQGESSASGGTGIYGYGAFRGVVGASLSNGVHGEGNDVGVEGWSYNGEGLFGWGFGNGTGLRALASGSGSGADVKSQQGVGLVATSVDNTAIVATANNQYGTAIQANGATGVNASVYTTEDYSSAIAFNGYAWGNGSGSSYGAFLTAMSGDYAYGVYGHASGGTESWAGYFTTNVYIGGYLDNPSDVMFKKNIQPIEGGLAKVMAMRPKTYEMKVDEFKGKVSLPPGKQYGVIAQELEEVLPELVNQVTAPAELTPDERKRGVKRDPTKFKSVNYMALIPILVQAIQEQQAEIEALKGQK
jgi:hypothetical protein